MNAASETDPATLQDNAAWATVQIPLPAQRLHAFLADVERLFRLNPYLEIAAWRNEAARSYLLSALNEMNGCRGEVLIRVDPLGESRGYLLVYDRGLKHSTELSISPAEGGSQLTITDRYHLVSSDSDERLQEVDRSLVPWAAALRSHLKGLARFGRLPGYRWWNERFMLKMQPRQRRIVRMIFWVSVLEFIVFLAVALIFWLETKPS